MAIARAHNPLRKLLVKRLGDAGGPRADDVGDELDSIIDGVNDIEDSTTRITNVAYCIHRNTTATGNVGTGLDSLHSFSLPANSLATNGDYLKVVYAGTFAGANTKRIVVTFGGQTFEDTGLIDLAVAWNLKIEYTRLSTTSILATGGLVIGHLQANAAGTGGATGGGRVLGRASALTVSDVSANATTMLVQAESSAAANDQIVQRLSIIELVQQ